MCPSDRAGDFILTVSLLPRRRGRRRQTAPWGAVWERSAQRFRLVRGLVGVAFTASDHSLRLALVASLTAVLTCRLACAVVRPRIEPAMLFAPLSHMLRNGFFFNHGLRTRYFLFVETSGRSK